MITFGKDKIGPDAEITLGLFSKIIWSYRFFIILITFITSIFSVYYSLSLPNIYSSKSLIIVGDAEGRAASSLSASYGGIAQMAGINLGGGMANKSEIVLETIRSREFLKNLITFDSVLPNLMAVDSYDESNNKIIYNKNIYDAKSKSWVRDAPHNRSKIPSYIEAYDYYIKLLNIKFNKISGFISIEIKHQSPEFANDLSSLILNQVNFTAKKDDLNKADDALYFLNEISKSSQTTEVQEAINYLIANKLKSKMVASIDADYLIKVIDAPFIPEKKSLPNRPIICILGSLLGLFASVLLSLVHNFYLPIKNK